MKCDNCKGETRVVATRSYDSCVFRVRQCQKCLKSFTTVEETTKENGGKGHGDSQAIPRRK